MCIAVLVLALVAAIDPVRIGIVALLISRPRPMLNLFVFWLSGIAAGIVAALVLLLFLRDLMLSLVRVAVFAAARPAAAHIQVAVGLLAVLIAALIAARFLGPKLAPATMTGAQSSVAVLEPKTRTGSSPRPIRRQLEGGSLVVAFVAGIAWATPPVEYLAAIIAILASQTAPAGQVIAALMFTLVAFTGAEIPLISYLAMPAKTLAVVLRLHDWISARRQAILAVAAGAFGALLVFSGMAHG